MPSTSYSFEYVDASDFRNFGNISPCILGIDEAGRGPVLGPMVYGCALMLADKEEQLKELGVNDSKLLSEGQRTKIFTKMQTSDFVTHSLCIVHPRVISMQMKRRIKQSLNEISHNCAIALIQRVIDNGIFIKEVFVDLVGQKEEIYQALLQSHFPSLKITVSKRADSLYPIVGAASIAAKVTRDSRIVEWTFEEQGFDVPPEDIGSGYPADPTTKRFIAKHIEPVFGYPSLVRFSWKTVETILERRAIKCKWNVDMPATTDMPKQSTLLEFLARKTAKKAELNDCIHQKTTKKFGRHAFFSGHGGLCNISRLD